MEPSPDEVFALLSATALREVAAGQLPDKDRVGQLAQQTGVHAFGCVAAAATRDTASLVGQSASLLSAVTRLWAAVGIEPDEIWMELHKRERLSSLLHAMTTDADKPKRRAGQPWRVDSTKLP